MTTKPNEIVQWLRDAMIGDELKQRFTIALAKARLTLSDVDFEDVLEKVRNKITEIEKELN